MFLVSKYYHMRCTITFFSDGITSGGGLSIDIILLY